MLDILKRESLMVGVALTDGFIGGVMYGLCSYHIGSTTVVREGGHYSIFGSSRENIQKTARCLGIDSRLYPIKGVRILSSEEEGYSSIKNYETLEERV